MLIAPEKICFGRWQLDAQRRTLLADGTPVALNGRAFDLLELLVARRGQAVTRDELIAHVWQDVTVGENNLTVQMSHLRKVLGDDSGMILTVPRGYKFAGEVEELPVPAGPANKGQLPLAFSASSMPTPYATPAPRFAGWGFRAAASAAVLMVLLCGAALVWQQAPTAPRLSIAVLPFRSLGADTAQADLADALTDDLTTDLAHIPASTVIARESAEVWRGKAATVQQIARSLRVRYVVEGSIMKEESQYHVNAQLIDADTGAHLWAERFEAPQGRLGEVRDAIVRKLATALDFQITQIESARSLRDRPDDPDALDLFFRARAILDATGSLVSFTQAQHLLEQAAKQQPEFADALAELGTLLVAKIHDTNDPDRPSDMAEARDTIARALRLSPTNAKAMAAEGHRLEIGGDCIAASYSARAALTIEPSSIDAEAVLADCARKLGHLDEAVAHLHALLRLSPDGPKTGRRLLALGYIHLLQGSAGQAVDELRRAIADSVSKVPAESMNQEEVAWLMLIAATQMQGNKTGARQLYNAYRSTWPNRTVWRFGAMFTKADASLPGAQSVLNALGEAGMPRSADEHYISERAVTSCGGGDFDETPNRFPNANTLDTKDVVGLLRTQPNLLLIDLATGVGSPPTAIWYDELSEKETPNDFVRRVARHYLSAQVNTQIIIMGSGAYGCDSLEAVATLVHAGFINVGWYRGGEEAWANSGQPTVNRRAN